MTDTTNPAPHRHHPAGPGPEQPDRTPTVQVTPDATAPGHSPEAPPPQGRPADPGTPADAATRWPDVHGLPAGRVTAVRAGVARALLRRAVRRLPLRVVLPDGTWWGAGTADDPQLVLLRPEAFFARVGRSGLIGFGESFMAGEFVGAVDAGSRDTHDPHETYAGLGAVLTVLAGHLPRLVPTSLQWLRTVVVPNRAPGTGEHENTPSGARRNIQRHYDLSNDMFETFLDPTLTYSSALFEGPLDESPQVGWSALADAQRRKIDRLLDAVGAGPGTRLLEIGTGWGELSLRAAARGAHVHTLTLSHEQAELARARVQAAGLAHLVHVDERDYRTVEGTYDAVVSVEMIEAVGLEYLQTYFDAVSRALRPGGRFGLQAITMSHRRMLATRASYTWIHKYVFPGGAIPSPEAMRTCAHRAALAPADDLAFGLHYAHTLRLWRERFAAQALRVAGLGFDDVFRRLWIFYLAYSEAGFRSGYLDVHQSVFVKSPAAAQAPGPADAARATGGDGAAAASDGRVA